MTELDFAALISPLSVSEFFEEHWGQRPMVQSTTHRDRFDGLVCVEDVEMLATIGLSLPNASSMVLAARVVDNKPDYWNAPKGVGPNVAIHSLLHAFEAGYSIVLNSVDGFWAPLNALSRQLESDLQQPVSANLYYSPGSVQGFPAHFDKFDVLVVQFSGVKQWDIFEPETGAISSDADPWAVPSATGTPYLRAVLNPGEVLYLPRGWSHRVHSKSEASLHVTFGIRSLRWADLVMRAAQRAVDANDELQHPVPLHTGLSAKSINTTVQAMVGDLVVPSDYDSYAALMAEVLRLRLPSLRGQSGSIAAAKADLDPQTKLYRRAGLTPLISYKGDEVTIRFAGNGVTTDAHFGAALELVASSDEYTVQDLSTAIGEDATELARALILNGLLTTKTD